jgi:1,4-alpha-glucan branching enzyme
MIRKMKSMLPNHVRVVFELPACVWADRIYLSGDFNQWDERNTALRQDRDGVWRVALDLPAGSRYEFRYIVDGQWRTDFHADGCTGNQYGAHNSVVVAELPALEPAPSFVGNLVHEAPARPDLSLRTRRAAA